MNAKAKYALGAALAHLLSSCDAPELREGQLARTWIWKVTPRQSRPKDIVFDLDNERVTIQKYRGRIHQADALGEFALSEVLRGIAVLEQGHLIERSGALGIEAPEVD